MSSITFADPFAEIGKRVPVEKVPDAKAKRRQAREKRLGRPVGQHGGKREGAGRKRIGIYNIPLKLTRIQHAVLLEEGKGNLAFAIQKAIDKHY
jgi:hypothetical protein